MHTDQVRRQHSSIRIANLDKALKLEVCGVSVYV